MKRTFQHSEEFRQIRARLGKVGWVAIGSLVERGEPGKGGPRYQWSRRVEGKTITVALSREQFDWLKVAIQNQREANELFGQLQRMTLEYMWKTLPCTTRRKRLSKRILGA